MTVTPPGEVTSAPTLHFLYDPLCGWCYAAAPLLDVANTLPGLALALHGGGMLSGANRRRIDARWRDYVIPHDRRIALLSGQPFGDAYFDGLLRDHSAVLDSSPPITAICAADALAGRGPAMLKRLQHAHFVEGRRIADTTVLLSLAGDIGLDPAAFAAAFKRLSGDATDQHIRQSRALLAEIGGQGFPTFVLQQGEHRTMLDVAPHLGKPASWAAYLVERIGRKNPGV